MLQLVQSLRTGEVELVDLPNPVPRENRVLVRTSFSLISPGTEQALARTASKGLVGKALDRPEQVREVWEKAAREGLGPTVAAVRARLDDLMTPGYSSAGVVEAVGPAVEGLAPGDRVGCVGANVACHAELAVVPAPLSFQLPETLETRWGAFGALGAIAAHGVRLAKVEAGSVVAVIGLGLVGQLAAQLVTAAGGRAIGIDTDRSRVELAEDLGAVAGAPVGGDDAVRAVMTASGGIGADSVVIAAASKDGAPLELAGRVARDRAVISLVGDVRLEAPRSLFYEKELQLHVSRSYGPGRYDVAYEEQGHDYPIGYVRWTERRLIAYFFEEVASGRIQLDPLVSHEFEFREAGDAYRALEEPGRMAIILRYSRRAEEPSRLSTPTRRTFAPNPSGRTRVALIGPGLFARSTLLPILSRHEVDLVAIAGGSGPRALSAARQFNVGRIATSTGEVLDDPEIDAVVIATRHDSHASLACAALECGKSVFLEKPLAIDQPSLDRLGPLLQDGGRLVVDFNRRFAPAAQAAIAALDPRSDPLQIHCRVNAGALPADHWLRDRSRGGGRLVGEGCHFVDLSAALVGRSARSVSVVGLRPGPLTLPGDSFVLTLTYDEGSVATVAYVATGHPRMPKERVEILGAGHSLVIEDFRRLRRFGKGLRPQRLAVSQDKGHGALLSAALHFFRNGGDPPIPYDKLLSTSHTCLVARDLLEDGSHAPVELHTGSDVDAESSF
ncbi:MAG: bi-domain-containing oxidoreductase [Actinomycetota bacterium]|nr:bi-domain-containing oxidoreductase [Actinomycetota bacterium]